MAFTVQPPEPEVAFLRAAFSGWEGLREEAGSVLLAYCAPAAFPGNPLSLKGLLRNLTFSPTAG